MDDPTRVIVAGGGIGGLAAALTCHELGIPVTVYEAVEEVRPLGVGINLQPNAVRELQALGLGDALASLGVPTSGVSMYSRHGGLIWSEPRGIAAGYRWPQYSVHRGELQMLLYEAVTDRLGPDAVRTSSKVTAYANDGAGVTVQLTDRNGASSSVRGRVLVGADGIHSRVRAQMYPDEGEPIWSGAILWRGTTEAVPYLDGATMVFTGYDTVKFVSYPISAPDPDTGLATINWIANLTVDRTDGFNKEDYSREASADDFLPAFDGWTFAWYDDIEALVRGAERIYEYPMVDRDPLPLWTDGNVTLLGDAAHVMYPVGSNGASQAIVDARKLGRSFVDHGVGPAALRAYDDEMRPATEPIILRNRRAGPDHIMQVVEERCGGVFDDIAEVMSHEELTAHADGYKRVAGFAVAQLNASPPIIEPGSRVGA